VGARFNPNTSSSSSTQIESRHSFSIMVRTFLAPCLAALAVSAQTDLDIVRERRLSNIVGSSTGAANIALW
jgi:hypothetical protein